jgi:acetyl esterase
MIYFHEGACIGGKTETFNGFMARYAVECGITVINVDYRLSPGVKAPMNINDGYAATKYIIDNAEQFGIDKSRICIAGASGGAYITAGTAMRLAERDEGNLIKF